MAMTIAKNPISQSDFLKADRYYHGHPGICAEVTRHWIKTKATGAYGFGVGGTMDKLLVAANRKDLVAKQDAQSRFNDNRIKGLKGAVGGTTDRTGYGEAQFSGLRSREDVINQVLAVPGLYVYNAASGKVGGGAHAFAFDSRGVSANRTLFFVDPNQFEWHFTEVTRREMVTWWSEFWGGTLIDGPGVSSPGINYKNEFHRGHRRLVRYTVPE
jgi:hypothetical protein